MPATVWVKPMGGSWQPIGSTAGRGVWHEDLTLVSDQWGPKTATFSLKRQQRAAFPDLLTRTPIAVDVDGVRVWRGRIKTTPEQSGAARLINVECDGGQAILDRDQYERVLVHNDLTAYRDARGHLNAVLGNGGGWYAAGTVSNSGGVVATAPQGSPIGPVSKIGMFLDLGESRAKRIVVTYDSSNNDGAMSILVRGADDVSMGGGGFETTGAVLNNAGASGTLAGTLATPRRYVLLFMQDTGAGHTPAADVWVRFKTVQVFADTAYESGNASVLSSKAIIVDALTRATTGLHPDWTGLGDPTFAFPEFAPDRPRTAREAIAAANAPHAWRFKIDEQLRPIYQARPTVPVIELGAWQGAEGDSGSFNNDEGIATKVIVRGTGPDGTAVRSTGSQTGTIVDRQGDIACVTLDTSYKLNQTFADKLRDTYLVTHRVSPFKGQNVVTANGARRPTGGTVQPAHLLLLTGELARRTDLVDPDTGAVGRNAVIDQVTWRAAKDESAIDLDNTRRDFEALQERLGLLVPA